MSLRRSIPLSHTCVFLACCVLVSAAGNTSSAEVLSVVPSPPAIAEHPVPQSVNVGQTAIFNVSAVGSPPLGYQWQKNGANITGATDSSFTTPPVTADDNGTAFRCIVYNSSGSVISNIATLFVGIVPPVITTHPSNRVVTEGQTATFDVSASGSLPLSYQWQRNGILIEGEDSASYATPPASFPDNGSTFRCIVTNAGGSDTSNEATLTVTTASLGIGPWERHVIDPVRPSRAVFIAAADIDGDGHKDVVTGAWWYKNPGAPNGNWIRHTIGEPMTNMAAVYDFDDDGYPDILGTALDFFQSSAATPIPFVWARNNGNGTFTIYNNIEPAYGNFLKGTTVDQLQIGGPRKVVLSWQNKNVGVQTFTVPADPINQLWQWSTIFPASQGGAVGSGDIDHDGDNDLLLGTRWLRNDGHAWNASAVHPSNEEVDRSKLVDVDGDGRLDAVVGYQAESIPGKLAWYMQGTASTDPWPEHIIATVVGPMSMDVADIDADGDLDVIVGEHNLVNPSSARLLVIENRNGLGTEWAQHLVYTGDEHHGGSLPVDIDGDGDLDIVSIGWEHSNVIIYENKTIDGPVEILPPIVSLHPIHTVANEGASATFSVMAEGTGPLAYQWQRGVGDIAGATGSLYTTPPLTAGENGTTYRCRVSNPAGTGFSNAATLVVSSPILSPNHWVFLSSATGDLPPPTSSGAQQTASLILDIDNDGVNDFVITERRANPSVVWYRRTLSGWDRYVIEHERLDIEAGGAFHDIDGDGDLDIVFGGDSNSNTIWWWESPYPNFNVPWTRRTIKADGGPQHHDMMFGDFNGDGGGELVFWNQKPRPDGDRLFMARIPNDPLNATAWPLVQIFRGIEMSEGLTAADIDGDGLLDIVGGGYWLKHAGSDTFIPHEIDASQSFSRVAVGQLVPGGQPEVVFNSGDGVGPLAWYRWNGATWQRNNLLPYNIRNGHSLDIADIDGDGHLDIFAASMALDNGDTAKAWVFYGDGTGNFIANTVSTGFDNHESRLADLDGDGDMDILSKPFNSNVPNVAVWLNNGTGPRVFALDKWRKHVIDPGKPYRTIFLDTGDIDGDGLTDIITGGWWYKNPGQPGATWTRHTVGAPMNQMALVYDFDGDGHLDILGTQGIGSQSNNNFAWARNDGTGNFTTFTNIESGNGNFLQGTTAAHFDASGPLQVMLAWNGRIGGTQALTLPAGPATGVWQWSQISPVTLGEGLDHGDIDGDGDLDILLGTAWLRNDGGAWTAFTIHIPDTGEADRNILVDMDGDGDLDAVIGYGHDPDAKLAWYENPGDPTGLWIEHLIISLPKPVRIRGFQSVSVVDIDGDGDWDITAGEHNNPLEGDEKLFIFENLDGRGYSWRTHLIDSGEEHHLGAIAVDIDGDGDLDIVSMGWMHNRILLYENLAVTGTPIIPARVVSHPGDQIVVVGHSASFRVTSTGTPPISYQWQREGVDIAGTTLSIYTIPVASPEDSGATFRCVVSNAAGSDTSNPAALLVFEFQPRVTDSLQVLYTFQEGSGTLINDVSGVGTPLNLTIAQQSTVTWLPQVGLRVDTTTMISSPSAATKIRTAVQATNEVTVEAWVKPANTQQKGPARMVSISGSINTRNVTLGQGLWADKPGDLYNGRVRTTATNTNGQPELSTVSGSLTTSLTHVVFTRTSQETCRIYVNGIEQTSSAIPGTFSNWDAGYRLFLANEASGDRPWLGEFYLVAVYNRALSDADVMQNFLAGAGIIIPPAIVTHPVSQTAFEGGVATFTVLGAGTPPLHYQWEKNGVSIPDANGTSYTTPSLSAADNGATYRCKVSGAVDSVFSNTATVTVLPGRSGSGAWMDTTRNYRVPVDINASGYRRNDQKIAETPLDFTTLMNALGDSGTFNEHSLRVIEVNSENELSDSSVGFQFDKDPGFDPETSARGVLLIALRGVTEANGSRFFDVYFDTTDSFTQNPTPPQITIVDDVMYEGQMSYVVTTPYATYYYHKLGGGFAGMVDNQGADWITYRPTGGSAGEFRGIPNLGEMFHPGYTNSASSILHAGPLRVTISSQSPGGGWRAYWEFHPGYAKMSLLNRAANYWFLYEGTPGGAFNADTDYVVRSTGIRTPASDAWTGDLPGEEWVYFGDGNTHRTLYVIHHEDDEEPEYYRAMEGNMTVFGFGRQDPCCTRYMSAVPQHFTIGFAEDSAFVPVSEIINSAYKGIHVIPGEPQKRSSFDDMLAKNTGADSELPTEYALLQNYPNPFNPVTHFRFDLPADAHTTLIIYNVLGQEVVRLFDGPLKAGRHRSIWQTANTASGVYFYRLQSGGFTETKRMVLLK